MPRIHAQSLRALEAHTEKHSRGAALSERGTGPAGVLAGWHTSCTPGLVMTIRQILVPTDFSEPSEAALDSAAELARALGASIDVLHVWEAPVFVPPSMLPDAGVADLSMLEIYRKNAESALEQFVAKAKDRGVSVRASFAELGPAAYTIADFARRREYDLIVIGTHGRTGLAHIVIGSVAERVVRYAPCPVLAVRAKNAQKAAA